MRGVIETERQLRASFRKAAREKLGPEASDADVAAWTDEAYYGTRHRRIHTETPEEQEVRERRTSEEIKLMDRWGVPEL